MPQDFIFNDELTSDTKDNGFLYILSNPAYPDCIKIGRTTRLPRCRAAELSKNTATPFPFFVQWGRFFEDDLFLIEQTIHEKLDEFRINKKREFFRLPVSEAIKKVDDIIAWYFSFQWGNIKYRKYQDAMWGFFFEKANIPFEYIIEPIETMDGYGRFLPGFYLPDQDVYFLVSKDFLYTNTGKLMAYCFAQKTGKVIFQFWDCQPGIEYDENGDFILHTGTYLTPEGEFDGGMEWGICKNCGSKHIGHFGFPDLCDRADRNTSKNNCRCHTDGPNEELLEAYGKVQWLFGKRD